MAATLNEPLIGEAPDIHVNWEDRSCCCCEIAYFPDGDFTMCGHWRRHLRIPILVSISFIITFASFVYDTYDSYPSRPFQIFALTLMSFLAFCIMFAYFAIMCRGPGYVPFNWSRSRKTSFTWREFMDNMVAYREQQDFARSNHGPPRSSFSFEARRFVLRAIQCDRPSKPLIESAIVPKKVPTFHRKVKNHGDEVRSAVSDSRNHRRNGVQSNRRHAMP
jgi:hypothetical protein